MYSTSKRGRYTNGIPVYTTLHFANLELSNIVAKNKMTNFVVCNEAKRGLILHFMKSKQIFYIIFFVGLVAVFYIFLTKAVPEFGKKKFQPIGIVNPFSFTTQDDKILTRGDVDGKVYVVEYFFTTCRGICPKMNNNMKTVYEKFKDENSFLILSHTSDPEIDTAATLKRYADSMGVNTNKWIFLTGRKDSLYNMARFSYKIDDPANNLKNINDDFLHTQFWALVNKKGEVKKIYDGLKQSEVQELISEAEKLLKE
jgi:protein SCO1/2